MLRVQLDVVFCVSLAEATPGPKVRFIPVTRGKGGHGMT